MICLKKFGETHDDITLIWRGKKEQEVEFIQVKNLSLESFWSATKLCQREKTNANADGNGSSLLEKSFAHDRCTEPCKFRIITSLPTNASLKILTLPLSSPLREVESDELIKLTDTITKKLNSLTSPNNNNVTYWIRNTKWQVESEKEIITSNKSQLMNIISNKGVHLTGEIVETKIYPQVLALVQNAAATAWEIDQKAKKIQQEEFLDWFDNILRNEQYPLSAGAGEKLKEKMTKAKIANDYIVTALDERRKFRQERLDPKYLDLTDLDLIEGEVLSELKSLRLRLDGGEFTEGTPFLKTCRDKLRELQDTLPVKSKPPSHYLDGCMYDITDRCAHRYHRDVKRKSIRNPSTYPTSLSIVADDVLEFTQRGSFYC
ncbi:MAG: DUF4297 domain-containing protein [Anaerolineales bacterium]|nr:DUF4297 domain-containing protein [Anaerolineales bacterium]